MSWPTKQLGGVNVMKLPNKSIIIVDICLLAFVIATGK